MVATLPMVCLLPRPSPVHRWTEVAAKLGHDYTNLTGDVLLAAGCIAYLGPFTSAFRDKAVAGWAVRCR